jgi:hypothetical protein
MSFHPIKKIDKDRLTQLSDTALALHIRRLKAYPKNATAELPSDCDPKDYILSRESLTWKAAYRAAQEEQWRRWGPIIAGCFG